MKRERGMVTAELATVAPFVVALTFLLLWVVSLSLTQIRIADASREAARMLARGESTDAATRVARRQSPDGATVTVDTSAGIVEVSVTASSRMPLPFFAGIGARRMRSVSVAAVESP
ncbi:TadE family type IV pilus minor pilin [Aeromicrobium sp.]|uniref:TadE family type IV pilus minor pilin n=1 Tax=Aeromicrobium sp. TaxID=1871063 RepID=UPI003C35ECA1